MKTKILLLFLFFSSEILFSQIINIPDPVFKSKLIEIGVDTNNDGEIEVSEALARQSVNVASYQDEPKIENLDGIQYFTNLTGFSCAGNLLTNLDVSSLTNLVSMNARNNQLVSINLNGLNQLDTIWISNNFLDTIDVSTLTDLRWLWCSNNLITNLDVSSNFNLKYLFASDNMIPSLNLLPLTLLEDLTIDNNQITSLSVNHLNNLYQLSCSNNLLTEIDVSNMPELRYLIIGNNLLSELDCSTNGTEQIHCNNNPNLTSINIQNSVISYTDPDQLWWGLLFNDLPSLISICIDPGEVQALNESGYDPENVTVYMGPNCTLGIDEFSKEETYIYPNPVKDTFVINTNVEIANYIIFDITGKQINSSSNVNSIKLSISDLNNGLYFLKLVSYSGNETNIRFVKE